MGAETTVHVKVAKMQLEWIRVSAVTLQEARDKAEALPGIAMVLDARYEEPEEGGSR